jgi:hypothetical protein
MARAKKKPEAAPPAMDGYDIRHAYDWMRRRLMEPLPEHEAPVTTAYKLAALYQDEFNVSESEWRDLYRTAQSAAAAGAKRVAG